MSYLAFDFTMDILVVRAKCLLDQKVLPAALRPLDCEISFDDIIAGGISIVEEKLTQPGTSGWQVTVTVSCKRPPRFFTEFERRDLLTRRSRNEERRRATAMDFALTEMARFLLFRFDRALIGRPSSKLDHYNLFQKDLVDMYVIAERLRKYTDA